jgi:chromosome segregation ATPase
MKSTTIQIFYIFGILYCKTLHGDFKLPKQDEELLREIQKLKEDISDYETRIQAKEIEIRARGEKLSELIVQLNDSKLKNSLSDKEIENLHSKTKFLEAQVDKLEKEKSMMVTNSNKLLDNLGELTASYKTLSGFIDVNSKDSKEFKLDITEKNKKIVELEGKVKQINERVYELSTEKDKILRDKMSLMEANVNEKIQLSNQVATLGSQLRESQEKVKDLREKMKGQADGLIGGSMEIETLKKKIDEKDRRLVEVSGMIEGMLTGETGIITDTASFIDYLKQQLSEVNRSLRIVLPRLSFIQEHGLLEIIKKYGESVNLNIAAPVKLETDMKLIDELKGKNAVIVDTSERNMLGLSVNGANIALAVVSGDKIRGIYTTIYELVNLLNAALMNPFVKGKKV